MQRRLLLLSKIQFGAEDAVPLKLGQTHSMASGHDFE